MNERMSRMPAGSKKFTERIYNKRYIYLMALPVILYYLIFHYIPITGNIIAFQDFIPFKGFLKSEFVGFQHFIDFFNSPYAFRVIRNTILMNVLDIIFGFPFPIILALLINEIHNRYFKKVVQTISYFPHFISLVVVCGMIADFSRTTGLFNVIRDIFGLEAENLLINNEYFRTIFVGSGIWKQVGWNSILYMATISAIDPTLYEAAEIDGAGRFKKLWHITLSSLVPLMTIQFILRIGNVMSVGFEKVILLYNPSTYEVADVITSFVYRRGLEEMNYSFGTAVGLFNSVINVIFLVTANRLIRKYSENSLW